MHELFIINNKLVYNKIKNKIFYCICRLFYSISYIPLKHAMINVSLNY